MVGAIRAYWETLKHSKYRGLLDVEVDLYPARPTKNNSETGWP